MKYPREVETMKRKQKQSKNDKNRANFKFCARFTFLESRIEDFDSIFQSLTCCLPIAFVCNLTVARLDYLQGYLELKKEEQSRATNWGLIGEID
ncbi:hypothetical protein M9H77_35906 [Catharanthus roseus]|uniref:Uncharacterized protein n=1 Tax=Catharanthus roseus TaxID=4058 RepID=A0ACB9ZSW8_CATRO|nr:hypothetical protein M9H77_35906 [Catharanthus roseus]